MPNQRGVLNQRAKDLSHDFFGRDITIRELRLLPYLDYCCKNPGEFSARRINSEELTILEELDGAGHIHLSLGGGRVLVTKPFYDYMQQVLFASYVEPLEGGEAE